MWNNQFLFATASLITILLWISFGLIRHGRRTVNYRRAQYFYGGLVSAVATIIAAVVIVAGRVRYYRDDLSFPSVGSLFTVLIGVIIGSFSAKYVWSLFGQKFGRRDPLIGAVTLFLISVAYSLPLYHKEISGLLSDFGISTIKTSFVELTFAERSNNNRGGAIGATGGKEMSTQALPRSSDPKPGLQWLSLDVSDDPDATIGADKQYLIFFEPTVPYKEIISKTQKVLLPVQALASCLMQYITVVPDSQLLLVDIKPVMEAFFTLHAKAKRELPNRGTSQVRKEISGPIEDVLNTINNKFGIAECEIKGSVWDEIHKLTLTDQDIYYLQPYTVLVLADLLVAHGATDEAISVLAEWLTNWNKYREQNGLPEWFKFRVASRLSIFMFDAAGQYNIAYRDLLELYRSTLEAYMDSSNPDHIVSLHNISEKCKSWIDLDNTRDAVSVTQKVKERVTMEQRALFLLLINEHESLRTEIAFLTEESNFEALQKLVHRANFLASIGPECLPKNISRELRSGLVATDRVTAGLLNLSVADRVTMLARSSGDRERALDTRRQAEEQLQRGWEELRQVVMDDRARIALLPLEERVFMQSRWEPTARLATQALSRVHGEGE